MCVRACGVWAYMHVARSGCVFMSNLSLSLPADILVPGAHSQARTRTLPRLRSWDSFRKEEEWRGGGLRPPAGPWRGAGDAESSADFSSQKVGVLGKRTCFSVCHHRPEEQSLAGPERVTTYIVQAGKLRPAGHEACPNHRASEQHCGHGLGLRAPPPPHLPRGHAPSPAPSVITPQGSLLLGVGHW